MSTIRVTGNPVPSVYSGQQKPYAVQQTQQSQILQPVPLPAYPGSALHVFDTDDTTVSMVPYQIDLTQISGWLSGEVPTCCHIHNPDGALMIGTNKGHVWESNDGGLSWALTLDTEDATMKITSIASSGYALASTDKGAGSYGLLYERSDGGTTWTLRYTSPEPAINAVHHMGNWSTWVLITGGSTAAKTYTSSDRSTWTSRRTGSAPEGSGFYDCITKVYALECGTSGTYRIIGTSNGTTWSAVETLTDSPYPYTTAAAVAWQSPTTGLWYLFVSTGAGGIIMFDCYTEGVVTPQPTVYADATRGGPSAMVNYRGRVYVFLNGAGVSVPHSMLKLYCDITDTTVNAGFVQELEDMTWSVGGLYQPQNRYYTNFSTRFLIPVVALNDPSVYVVTRKNLIFL